MRYKTDVFELNIQWTTPTIYEIYNQYIGIQYSRPTWSYDSADNEINILSYITHNKSNQ